MEVGGQLHAPASLPPAENSPVSFEQEAGWASGSVWTQWNWEKAIPSSWTQTPAFHPVLSYPDSLQSYSIIIIIIIIIIWILF
jgi:hypothetical protein